MYELEFEFVVIVVMAVDGTDWLAYMRLLVVVSSWCAFGRHSGLSGWMRVQSWCVMGR